MVQRLVAALARDAKAPEAPGLAGQIAEIDYLRGDRFGLWAEEALREDRDGDE